MTAKAFAPEKGLGAELDQRLADLRRGLADEARRADILNRIAAILAGGGSLQALMQAVVDAGVELSGAEIGAFVSDRIGAEPSYVYSPPRPPADFPPRRRNRAALQDHIPGRTVIRFDDLSEGPRRSAGALLKALPRGHRPVRSYLATAVASRTGEVIGGLYFGHSRPKVFPERLEPFIASLAAQAALAIENLQLRQAALSSGGETEAHDRLQFALAAGRLGAWQLDVETRAYKASELCKANYGRGPLEPFGFEDLLASVHPEDRERMAEAIEQAIKTCAEYDCEYRVVYPSGEVRWVQARGRAAESADHGGVRRMAGISLDVTERKRAEERQKLLVNELNHRVKNTLATVQSLVSSTLRKARDPGAFRDAFEGRLLALSRTHNLLARRHWEHASLQEILNLELMQHIGTRGGGPRFVLESDGDVQLNAKAAVALGVAFHELAANAARYGALSQPGGRVTVRTRISGSDEDEQLFLEWRESGGPAVSRPQRRGFGGRVIEDGLAAELGGEVELDYGPEGLSCRMRLRMRALEP